MDRIVEIEKVEFDKEYEISLRPATFDDYIGQSKVKQNLKVCKKSRQGWMQLWAA